jgi:hypothetical protein
MFFRNRDAQTLVPQLGFGVKALILFLVLGAFYLGIFPGRVLDWTRGTAAFILNPISHMGN